MIKNIPNEPNSKKPSEQVLVRAINEGKKAFKDGLKENHCPYGKYSYERNAWLLGYERAMWEI